MPNPVNRLPFFVALIAAPALSYAQPDLSIVVLAHPNSGCALSNAEPVKLHLFNRGEEVPAGTAIELAYAFNRGNETRETLTLGHPLRQDAMLAYTFKQAADLSGSGSYAFSARVDLVGDSDPSNNSVDGHTVVNWAPSQGGTISGPAIDASGTLTLSGARGNVLRWQQSTDGGEDWETIENPSATLVYEGLRRTTQYRAEVANGSCTPAFSAVHTVAPN